MPASLKSQTLYKQALESQKTVSRRAKSKLESTNASPTSSKPSSRHASALHTPAMSRTVSRAGTRANSDDDDGYLSDDTAFSGSDNLGNTEGLNIDSSRTWEENLKDRIDELIDWKRSSTEGRELNLRTVIRMLQLHYAMEEIVGQETDILTSLLRSVKNESSDTEAIRALKAIEMLMVTTGEGDVYENASQTVQRTVYYSESVEVKAQAIRTSAFLAFFAGAAAEEMIKNMDFLLEIVESDGASIDAEDSADVVTAAIEGYSFLATVVDDLSEHSAQHAEILLDQLDSSSSTVQVAAGEAIALLYEKSYTEPEDDELGAKPDHTFVFGDDEKLALIRRYQASNNYRDVVGRLAQLSSTSGKSSRRKDLKAAKVNFKDILHSIENPTHGPKYSTAMDKEGTKVYGSRLAVKIGNSGFMKIDKWWKLICLQNLKKVLRGGFLEHYEQNPLIIEALPVIMSAKDA